MNENLPPMQDLIDLDRYPVHRPDSPEYTALLAQCRGALARDGLFNLDGFVHPGVAGATARDLTPVMAAEGFTHKRAHNIYFRKSVPDLPADHPALAQRETINHTLCADQMPDSLPVRIHAYPPLVRFLAATMGKPRLWPMADPLARVNVMSYGPGEALNWHFDRSEFTVTLLLQAPERGGVFEYRRDLRSDTDPNYAGVAKLLSGDDPELRVSAAAPGTLNVFLGKNTAHRVTPAEGAKSRMVAVLSYFDRPDVRFTAEERLGFYGRAG